MIIDHRTYTLHPGKIGDFLKIYEGRARAVRFAVSPERRGLERRGRDRRSGARRACGERFGHG
jgi:hypothetical protein